MIKIIIMVLKYLFGIKPVPEPLQEYTPEEFEKVKFKARVALIDDEEVSHVKRLQKEGYNIVDYPDIENIDDFLRKKYHVVILDIQGVGKDLAGPTEGWGLLKYIKHEAPHVVVIMFTGADWSVTKYKSQVELADDFIGKDLEYLDFKSKLDAAIRKAFSPKFQFEIQKKKIASQIMNSDDLREVEDVIFKYGRNKEKALKELKKITSNENVIQSADNFLSITSSIFSIINS
jgi:DNA-binding response OmpR family regulator